MKLYHLSLEIFNIVEEFEPKVPDSEVRLDSEDDTTARICLAKSIKGCLTAVPWGGIDFEEFIFSNRTSPLIRVYEFDSDDIEEGNIVESEELYQSDKVRDASITGEIWVINQKIKPRETYLIQVNDYEEGCADDISYENFKYYDEHSDEENISLDDFIEGCFTTINYIEYEIIKESDALSEIQLTLLIKDLTGSRNDLDVKSLIEKTLKFEWESYEVFVFNGNEKGDFDVSIRIDTEGKYSTKENAINIIECDFYRDLKIIPV